MAGAPRVGLGWWQIARKYYFALPIRMLRDRKRRLRDRLRQWHAPRAVAALRAGD
jgi:hypothetical protein